MLGEETEVYSAKLMLSRSLQAVKPQLQL